MLLHSDTDIVGCTGYVLVFGSGFMYMGLSIIHLEPLRREYTKKDLSHFYHKLTHVVTPAVAIYY
jgi:hypothetical protein